MIEELLQMLNEIQIPFAYHHFAEGESPESPFICYRLPGSDNFSADGIAYYVINNNMGYEGDMELALIPESFRTEVLKESLDENGVLIVKMHRWNWPLLHCCLNLMVTRDTSDMCFITVRHPVQISKARPMRIPERCRQRRLPLRQHRFLMVL